MLQVMALLLKISIWCTFSRYIDQFSRCLYVEYKKSGIDVQCQVFLCLFGLFFLLIFS